MHGFLCSYASIHVWHFFDTFWHGHAFCRRGVQGCCTKVSESGLSNISWWFFDTGKGRFFDTFWHALMPLCSKMQIVSKKLLTRSRVLTFFDTLIFWHVLTRLCIRLQWNCECQKIVSKIKFLTRFWHYLHFAADIHQSIENSVKKFLTRLLGHRPPIPRKEFLQFNMDLEVQ